MNPLNEVIKQKEAGLAREVRKQTAAYIVAGLGLVASLAWNEAIKGVIERFFPLPQSGLAAKFVYAGFVTLLVVAATVVLVQSQKGADKK